MEKICMGIGNTVTTYVDQDEELIINKRKIYREKYPRHSMIGWLNRKDSRKRGDLQEEIIGAKRLYLCFCGQIEIG